MRFSSAVICGLFCALLAACSTTEINRGTYIADTSYHAPSADSRVRFLVMHYTQGNEARSLAVLTGDDVSVHYVVPDNPRIENGEPVVYQLVPETERAWHAGKSEWQGTTERNAASIGIENVNVGPIDTPQGRTWQPDRAAEVFAVVKLARHFVMSYQIPPTRVVGHTDIAPQRETDPGLAFPWRTICDNGIGAWPDATTGA